MTNICLIFLFLIKEKEQLKFVKKRIVDKFHIKIILKLIVIIFNL